METRSRLAAWARALGQLAGRGVPGLPFDLVALLGPRELERLFRRFVAHPDGQALLVVRPDLAEALREEGELLALPGASLGRACLGEVALPPRQGRADARLASAHDWFEARLRVLPGVWRVLAGFEADRAGGAELLAFCAGALRQRPLAILSILVALLTPGRGWWHMQRSRLAAWRCGREAVQLLVIPYELLLPCSLHMVRRSLRIGWTASRASRPVAWAHGIRSAS